MSVCLSVCWLVKQRHPPIIRNGPYGAKVGEIDIEEKRARAFGVRGRTPMDKRIQKILASHHF